MKKYVRIFQLTLQEYFVYRLNFILWRFRSFVFFVTLIIFWQAVYGARESLFGYQKTQIFAYILGIAILRGLVLGSRSADMAGQIKSGELTSIILRPISIFKYWFAKDLADKILNILFVCLEIFLALKIFNLPFYLPHLPQTYLFFILMVILAVMLYFFLSFALSASAFWTDDTWSTRWLFGVVFLEFFSGTYFPLDILPKTMVKIINLTPFPYLVYFPIKIWNEQVTGASVIKVILICFFWLALFSLLSLKLWRKGVKNYGAYGG